MADFRKSLYERYVSEFKGATNGEGNLKSRRKWWERKILPLLSTVSRSSPILEIGCGGGFLLEWLCENGFTNVEGVDVSDEQVNIAVARGLSVRRDDAFAALQNRQQAFGAVIAIDVVEHFTKDENLQLFQAVSRSLVPGGAFIIQTPNGDALLPGPVIYGDLTHMTIFNSNSLTQLLKVCGFDADEFKEAGPVAKNIAGLIRVFVWGLIKILANGVRVIECGKPQTLWTQVLLCKATKRP
jgi:2-polyprenyl-3-methyl-5-hydroxy-6-metoxy-1,4-benzoquinol methylase